MATNKQPGRIAQVFEVLGLVVKRNKMAGFWLAISTLIPLLAFIALALFTTNGNIVALVVYIVLGVMAGLLAFLIVLGRFTQGLMYENLQGQPGAVSALIKNQLRRSWRGNDVPIRVNKSQDLVYRLVGRPGVVLVAEGNLSRVSPLLEDAKREVQRIVPGVTVHTLHVGDGGLLIKEFFKNLYKLKGSIRTAEILVVSNRLASITKSPTAMMPKGIDPTKMRAPKPR